MKIIIARYEKGGPMHQGQVGLVDIVEDGEEDAAIIKADHAISGDVDLFVVDAREAMLTVDVSLVS